MATATMVAAPANPAMLDRSIILHLRTGMLGSVAKVDSEIVDTDADKDRFKVTKDILDSAELKAISKHDGSVRSWVRAVSLPADFLGASKYLIPLQLVEEVMHRLDEYRQTREGLIEKFLTAYPDLVERARVELKGQFDEADYPTAAQARKAFTYQRNLLTFSTPTALKTLSQGLFEREAKRMADTVQNAVANIEALLFDQMKKLLDHMVDRLTPGEDGKPKRFASKMVDGFGEVLELLSKRASVIDNEPLMVLLQETGSVLKGVDAKTIRDSESVRASVTTAFTDIAARLDAAVIDQPKRFFGTD